MGRLHGNFSHHLSRLFGHHLGLLSSRGSRLLEAKTRVGLESVACLGLIKSSSWMDLVSVGLVVWMTGGRRKLELELGDTDEGRFRYS